MGILQARILEWVATPFSRGVFPTQGSNPTLLYLLHWRGFFSTSATQKAHILWIALSKTERFSKEFPYRTVPCHLTIFSFVPGLLYSFSYLILPNNLHWFLGGRVRPKPREKFAECERREAETQRRSCQQALGAGYLLDFPPSARKWQAAGFLWSRTGKPHCLQEPPSGPAVGSPAGVGLGKGGR